MRWIRELLQRLQEVRAHCKTCSQLSAKLSGQLCDRTAMGAALSDDGKGIGSEEGILACQPVHGCLERARRVAH